MKHPAEDTVKPCQTWAEATPGGTTLRTLWVSDVEDGRATCAIGATGKRTKIAVKRLLSERKFTLVRTSEGKRVDG